jgi:uncharacterized protein with PIN domain
MITCRIILHGDLAALAGGRREVVRRLPHPTSARDAVEALGVPHVELSEATLDGAPAELSAEVRDGATLAVWPAEARELAEPRFVCDLHLGKLTRLLRYCGFDTLWDPAWREAVLARVAQREDRAVLSRHRALLKRSAVVRGLLLRSDDADGQLVEVLRRFCLAERIRRPGRCARCNGELVPTPKDRVPVPIPPRTAAWLDDYWLCAGCGQLYWEGTHVERLQERLARAVARARVG